MVIKQLRILVTGGAGFIGSHLVNSLVEANHKVVVVDNLSHGRKQQVSKKAALYVIGITSPKLSQIFQQFKPDIVYHLAAQQDVVKAQLQPLYDAEINILGTLNVLENCYKNKVRRIIYADSVAGFGEPKKIPLTFNHPRFPMSFYGISKHTVEHYLSAYAHFFGIPFVSLILANVYGPLQDPFGEGGVIAIFAERMKHQKNITIFGDGKQTRDFICVYDVVSAFVAALQCKDNQFLMVGTGKETSINQLFETMKFITKYTKNANYKLTRPGDVVRSVFSIKETREVIDWEPKWNLEKGLRSTIKAF